jgi:hypothetical protein
MSSGRESYPVRRRRYAWHVRAHPPGEGAVLLMEEGYQDTV